MRNCTHSGTERTRLCAIAWKIAFLAVLCFTFYTGHVAARAMRLTYVGIVPAQDSLDSAGDARRNGKIRFTYNGKKGSVDNKDDNESESSGDTVESFKIFERFEWLVKITAANGTATSVLTSQPDTLEYGEFSKVEMSTDFVTTPDLLFGQYWLQYELNGSVLVKLCGRPVLATGKFDTTGLQKFCPRRLKDFTAFCFTDTTNHLEITYLPHPAIKSFYLEFRMGQEDWAKEKTKTALKESKESLALGFYYLSFGIVFLALFLFFKEKKENLYFSMFCVLGAGYWIVSVYEVDTLTPVSVYLGAISMEFFSQFLSKVIRNKNRTKIPLIIMIVIAAVTLHPSILFDYSFFGFSSYLGAIRNKNVSVIILIVFVAFYGYTFGSSIGHIIKGFRQKSWEAKTVAYMCAGAICVAFCLPWIFDDSALADYVNNYTDFHRLLSNIGFGIFPLSAAIVIGRRTFLNQRELTTQVRSIEQLSAESLAREQEKKQILESGNAELEQKVIERTKQVLQQKAVIELKNKAITDNLTYARRIQSALLPELSTLDKHFTGSFVLYLPKDIVSGDFYSFEESSYGVLIAAGDCTGHGVSGAFMSMIGSSILSRIVDENGIGKPGNILNDMNRQVIESLSRTKNDSSDGMDIALCSFNSEKNELCFAGANRPAWIVSNGILNVIQPDKFPIGGLQVSIDRTFSDKTIPIHKGDTIYLFTDGYGDQFGGENGKKLMTARMKEMVLSIQQLDMQQQREHLYNVFSDWKGIREQVDDILVIGIKI